MRKVVLEELFKSLKEEAKMYYLKITYEEVSASAVEELFTNALLQAQKINT
jgi:diphthamide synthase subunit DPH2